MNPNELETPAVVVDLGLLEANIARLQDYLSEHSIANRPHIKTHRIPEIARMQVDAGAVGICCQKTSEAEVMADAGFSDIFIPYNIVGQAKLDRLIRLARRITLSVAADSSHTVRGYAAAAAQADVELSVLIEFDTGAGRCGVQSPSQAAELAQLAHRSPRLRFSGLMTHPCNNQSDPFVRETKALLQQPGIAVERVSYGGTPVVWQAHGFSEVTEYRAGTYVYGDRATVRSGAMALEECALRVLTTVVSRPTANRGIVDAGSKALTSDLSGLDDYGFVPEFPDARVYALSEEHGFLDLSNCAHGPEIGERVTVIPNHCCVVSNLYDRVFGVRDGQVETVWPVAARGRSQ
jgi:D-serine deaminase-like pyridoxal phosphate-dependent protein